MAQPRIAVDLEQPRSFGGILAATAHVYRSYPLLFAILALGVIAPYRLAVLAITAHGPLWHGHESTQSSWLLLLLSTSLVTPFISALHIHAVVAVGEGRRPDLRGVALRGVQALPVVAAAEVMANLGIALGLIALVIPGILLAIRWAVVAQAAALENNGWLEALRSSRRMTATHYGHVFVLIAFTGILIAVVSLGARALPLGNTQGVASVAAGIAVDTLTASFAALTLAFLYFDLRARLTAKVPRRTKPDRPYVHGPY
jgi:hypothetical protein